MYIGGALILIAIGAVLRWAVNVETEVIDIQLAGLIVFIIGVVAFLAAMVLWFTRRGPAGPAGPPDGGPDLY